VAREARLAGERDTEGWVARNPGGRPPEEGAVEKQGFNPDTRITTAVADVEAAVREVAFPTEPEPQ
jgi:hypothetical protein